jgi:hypothetical protein
MSTAAISSSSIFQELQSFYQTRHTDLNQLGSALQSGNLADAQQAFSALAALGQGGPFANSEPFGKAGRAQAFEAIGTALQAGDLAGAQAAFANLKSSLQNKAPTAAQDNPATVVNLSRGQNSSNVVAEIVINFNTSFGVEIGAPSPAGQPSTTGTTSNTNGATGVPEIVINLEGGSGTNASTGASSGSTPYGAPELVINLGIPNLGAPPNPGTSGGSDATPPPELILNLNAQQNYELIVNLVNPASTSQTGSLSSLSLQA